MSKIKLSFRLEQIVDPEDKFSPDEVYEQTSTVEVFEDLEMTELDVIGEQLNSFLSQMGYVRKGTTIFMESISEDEYGYLLDCLSDYRSNHKDCN